MHLRGKALLIGFDLPDGPLHDRVLDFSGLGRTPEIAYVGSANGDDRRWFQQVERAFSQRHGARVRHVLAHRRHHPRNVDILRGADLIYIASGDVSLLSRRLHEAQLSELLRQRHHEGVTVVGVSAGAIALTPFWIEFPAADAISSEPSLLPCLAALPMAVDCHDEDEDWPELRALLQMQGRQTPDLTIDAYGIPHGGALVLRGGHVVEHLGAPPKWLRLDRGRIHEA